MTNPLEAAVAKVGLPSQWSWRVEVRPDRRTLGLDVLPDGSIVIAVPGNAKPHEVADVVRSRQLWLAKAIRRRTDLAANHPAKEIVDGEGFTYLGRNYRLLLVDRQATPVRLHGGWLQLHSNAGASAIIDWYREHGQRWLTERAASWSGRIGIQPPPVVVDDLGARWGLRERDGSVAFHWGAMQLPPDLLDLVVVHELLHVVVSRHDDEFRRRLLLALPDAADLEVGLATAGRNVWMGAVRGA